MADQTQSRAQGGIASEAKSVVTRSAEETIAWGREFARGLKAPLLVLLTGDLGSGKTMLTKGIVAGLGAADEEDVRGPEWHYLWGLCHSERLKLTGHASHVFALKITTDGKTLFSVEGDAGLKITELGLAAKSAIEKIREQSLNLE